MNKYQLHSHKDNWFHFRKDLNSAMESFSVTYCHDGTVVMTGDYGTLAWRREWFSERMDYGFPDEDTWIGYFTEKVVRAEDQKIYTWKKSNAIEEINKAIEEYYENNYPQAVSVFKDILTMMDFLEEGEYGYIQMLELFNKRNKYLDVEDFYHFGRDYSDAFKMKFEMLKSVSGLILEAVKDEQLLNKIRKTIK